MQYFIVTEDGQKYGPADIPTINQWVKEGRVNPGTMLLDASTAVQVYARDVPEIIFQTNPSSPTFAGSNYPREQFIPNGDLGETELRTAWIFAVIGLVTSFAFGLCCSCLSILNIFSILGIIFSVNSRKKGNVNTSAPMICSIIGLVLGPVLALILYVFFQMAR